MCGSPLVLVKIRSAHIETLDFITSLVFLECLIFDLRSDENTR